MAFDGVVLKALINEFNTKLKELRIDKIYQPEKDEIVLGLRGYKENYKLFISADSNYPRINITDNTYTNPDKPPLFCMLLRKHLSSGKIISFNQIGSDRILDIAISAYNEIGEPVEKHLIAEIMGRYSNIILIDDKNIVVDSVKRVDFTVSSKRQLLPGLIYEMAPSQEKLDINNVQSDCIRNRLYGVEDVDADSLMMNLFSGVSPILSREVAYQALNESKCILTKEDLIKKASLYNEIEKYLNKFSNNEFNPNILYSDSDTPKYFSVVKLTQYESLYKRVDFDSPSKMIDAFYNELHFSRKIKLRSQNLTKHIVNLIEKLRKKINIHNDTLLNKDKYEQYKLKGELLSAHIYLLKGGENTVRVLNYYDGNEIDIELDSKLSPAKNIDRYYKLYKKGQKAMEYALEQIDEAKKELVYLEGELAFLENAKSQKDIDSIREELINDGYIKDNIKNNKRKNNQKPDIFTYVTADGFEILVGKNSRQNEYITFKLSKGNDLWFHVKNYPGAHVLLKSNNREFSDTAIMRAAEFAAEYSKDLTDKVTVDYTKIKFVKKIPGGKPGMVTYTNYSTLIVGKNTERDKI